MRTSGRPVSRPMTVTVISPIWSRWRCWAARVAAGLLFIVAAHAPLIAQAPKKDEFQTSAPYAILMDADSGTVLFERNADQLAPPSSMAKLMTTELVFSMIKDERLKLDNEFTVSENAWRTGGAPSHGSTMFAAIHSEIKVSDLLQGAIILSGNDACITLAEGIAGSEQAFAEMMTKRARELGLTQAVFGNSTGLPEQDTRMTVRELAKLAQHIINTYPDFYHYYGAHDFTWNKIHQLNRNPLLTMNIGADGLKTGYTKEGGYGMVGSAVQNGLRLIVVVNGLKTEKERSEEARKLLEFGFKGFESRPLFAEGDIIGGAKLYGGQKSSVSLVANGAVNLLVPRNSSDKIHGRVVYMGPVPAPVKKGQPIGQLKIWRGDNVVLEVPLQASESIGRGSLSQRAIDAASELMINLFRASLARL